MIYFSPFLSVHLKVEHWQWVARFLSSGAGAGIDKSMTPAKFIICHLHSIADYFSDALKIFNTIFSAI